MLNNVMFLLFVSFIITNLSLGEEKKTGRQREVNLPEELANSTTLSPKYLLYLPGGYGEQGKKWPLMLFLHGKGECGENIEVVKKNGPPMLIEKKGREFPFIVVSPQCRKKNKWNAKELIKLVEHIESKYKVDEKRIYVTGLSMGGFGTWNLITAYPDKFAAAVPVCGGGNPGKAEAIKDLPVWVFHGKKDKVVSIEKSKVMVDALKKLDSKVKFTVYPDVGHNSWVKAYETEELYKWMLEHKK